MYDLGKSKILQQKLEQRCMEGVGVIRFYPAWKELFKTASTVTLTALLTAREWKSGFRISKRGFDGSVYRIYASSLHSSGKSSRLAGFNRKPGQH
jgi:hypothetical protein